jgi:hypothetical protein
MIWSWSDLFKIQINFFLRSGNSAVFFALCRSPTARNTIRPFQETNYLMLNHLKKKKIDFKNQERNFYPRAKL